MNPMTIPPGFHPIRHDRLLLQEIHDSYHAREKLPEPSICPECGILFQHGRWQWGKPPQAAHLTLCPACQRIKDEFPAGFVTLSGPFFSKHREEIMQLISHEVERAARNHPLQRIMSTEELPETTRITTTDIHLARAIGEALHRAHQGKLDFHYNPEQSLLRVSWHH